MRLLRLLPEQIMEHWELIKECLQTSLPPDAESSEENLVNVQEKLLTGRIDCWIAVEDTNTRKVYGLMTTYTVYDVGTQTKNLLIYTVTTLAPHPQVMWEQAAEIMRDFAAKIQCKKIIAYSNNEDMLRIAEALGADTSFRMIVFVVP